MKSGQTRWSREESILAMNLYCKLPFGKMHKGNLQVIELAELIGRTPGSIAFKLVNFASLDPSLQARGIKGASNTSKLDREIWEEFVGKWDELPFLSEQLLAQRTNTSIEELIETNQDFPLREGLERETVVKRRINQAFFRTMVLASYDNACCITGLAIPKLLVAGHILPWSKSPQHRMNPRNGIAINALHDKAYESGLMTIHPDFRILISSKLLARNSDPLINTHFNQYHEREIILPKKFLPDPELLEESMSRRFLG